MKKRIFIIALLLNLSFVACSNTTVEQQTSGVSEETTVESTLSVEEIVSEEIEIPESYEVEPNAMMGEFDYECYLYGIYLSADGSDDKIYIHPIQFICEGDTEEIKKYGLEENWVGYYDIVDNAEEIIELPINEETEFLVYNWRHDQEMADNSINHAVYGWCLMKDPMYFWKCMQKEYGQKLSRYPMFIIMDESGYVDQVVEWTLA